LTATYATNFGYLMRSDYSTNVDCINNAGIPIQVSITY